MCSCLLARPDVCPCCDPGGLQLLLMGWSWTTAGIQTGIVSVRGVTPQTRSVATKAATFPSAKMVRTGHTATLARRHGWHFLSPMILPRQSV